MDEAKYRQLELAFLKALDASINSIGESDVAECFGDIRGNHIQIHFVNMIDKCEKLMENQFKAISQKYKIQQLLSAVEGSQPGASAPYPERDEVVKLLLDAQKAIARAETEELAIAVKALNAEIKKSSDMEGRLRTQLYNEIEALKEQSEKLQNVTKHLA